MEISTKLQNVNMSDDEDDLELLRLAALQTIKKPVINNIPHQQQPPPPTFNKIRRDLHRGRIHYLGPGRGGRGGQFNGRTRNTNLISITTVQSDVQSLGKDRLNFKEDPKPAPKLILPQDRYCNKTEEQSRSKEVSSKFSRYDHSDNSDSEEESESVSSECEGGAGKLVRANSLEALMQELEYEISGEKPKDKVKKRKAKRQTSENEVVEEKVTEETKEVVDDKVEKRESSEVDRIEEISEEEVKAEEEVEKELVKPPVHRKRSPLNGSRRQNRHFHRPHRNGFGLNYSEPPPNFAYAYPPNISYIPPNPYPPPPQLLPLHLPNYIAHRPLSPLNLNTEVLSTIAMAPLSPRSAAFVLQNREIIERRRKSPRRSYSRSPSPRFRSNCSRSPSPRRYTRSASPKRSSPARRVIRNTPPRKTSPLRPAKTNTPEQKESPKSRKNSPKPSIKDRLGDARTHKPEEVKVEDSKATKPQVENPVPSDSVLEARKRKFEEKPEVTAKEGIIRLKPKLEVFDNSPDGEKAQEECDDEVDDLLDLDVNDSIVDNLFSDEESDNENEGRFKLTSTNKRETTTILRFAQLSNRDRDVMMLSLDQSKRDQHCRRDRDHHSRDRRRRKRTTTPPRSNSTKIRKNEDDKDKLCSKSRTPKRERKNEHDNVLVIDNKKGESKSHSSENKVVERDVTKKENSVRKVAIAKSTKENADLRIRDVSEVIADEDDITVKNEAGDLRAQLSRKRAERQHKLPVAEDVQSRLLQNALEGAVFKKSKKLKKEKEAAPKDKVPIHMRLGLAKETDKYKETKRRKKKARSSEQV